jgi:hypothetical protein
MHHVTAVDLPRSTPFLHPPLEEMPETQSVLEEVGALYPVVAYWKDEASDSGGASDSKAGLDAETLDEVIFAGIVGLH